MHELLDLFRSLTKNLDQFTIAHGNTTYAILFAIVFCETGLVVMPFLPGDSLLFAAGAVASRGFLNPLVLAAGSPLARTTVSSAVATSATASREPSRMRTTAAARAPPPAAARSRCGRHSARTQRGRQPARAAPIDAPWVSSSLGA